MEATERSSGTRRLRPRTDARASPHVLSAASRATPRILEWNVRSGPIHWRPEGGRSAASPPCPRSDRLGVRTHTGAARTRAERLRARRLLGAVVGALRLQA